MIKGLFNEQSVGSICDKKNVCSETKGPITSMDNDIIIIFEIVPIPGVSRGGIQRRRTITPTKSVDKPTVKLVCSEIP